MHLIAVWDRFVCPVVDDALSLSQVHYVGKLTNGKIFGEDRMTSWF